MDLPLSLSHYMPEIRFRRYRSALCRMIRDLWEPPYSLPRHCSSGPSSIRKDTWPPGYRAGTPRQFLRISCCQHQQRRYPVWLQRCLGSITGDAYHVYPSLQGIVALGEPDMSDKLCSILFPVIKSGSQLACNGACLFHR